MSVPARKPGADVLILMRAEPGPFVPEKLPMIIKEGRTSNFDYGNWKFPVMTSAPQVDGFVCVGWQYSSVLCGAPIKEKREWMWLCGGDDTEMMEIVLNGAAKGYVKKRTNCDGTVSYFARAHTSGEAWTTPYRKRACEWLSKTVGAPSDLEMSQAWAEPQYDWEVDGLKCILKKDGVAFINAVAEVRDRHNIPESVPMPKLSIVIEK